MTEGPRATSLLETSYWEYLAAASVLTDFAAEKLLPLGGGTPNLFKVGAMLMENGEAITIGPAKDRWSIANTARRRTIAELKRQGKLIEALQANLQDMPDNPTQRAINGLLRGERPDLTGKSLRDLLGLEQALDLLGIENDTKGRDIRPQLLAKIEQFRLLEPLQRLVADGFAGRQNEMKLLRSYVDELPSQNFREWLSRGIDNVLDIFRQRPPLVVWGPGGVGKSTLLAKFLLDHAGPEQEDPIPFIFLDFDRGQLDPLQPDTLLEEAFRQIKVQFPEFATIAADLEAATKTRLAGEDQYAFSKSVHYKKSTKLRKSFVKLLQRISALHNKNILFFVDTFEVVQRRGPTPVHNVMKFAAELLRDTPTLRFVIAGRATLHDTDFISKAPKWKEISLSGFDNKAGQAYLQVRLKKLGMTDVSPDALKRIVSIVRGNPLCIRLAAQVFFKEGLSTLEDIVSKARFDAAFSQEQIQGMLHNRIVDHLPEKLRKIADPGLVVRRITPSVIANVLAGPCELDLRDLDEAEEIFKDLQREVSLVEPLGQRVLRHRPDVRLIMLPLLRKKLGDKARIIDEKAVSFWTARNDPESRAEELYHLLWLEADTEALENAWKRGPVAKLALEDALDEFEALKASPKAREWLSIKLEREISPDLERKAQLINWERNTELRVRGLLSSGFAEDALKAIRSRKEKYRSPTSSLWFLELEALKLLGKDEEALRVVETAQRAAADVHEPGYIHELLLQKTLLLERSDRFEQALSCVLEATNLAKVLGSDSIEFATEVTLARLLRKVGRNDESAELQRQLASKVDKPSVAQALAKRPALLSEATAELGILRPDLFIMAAKKMGLDSSEAESTISPMISLGVAYANRGDFQKAIELLDQAISIAVKIDDYASQAIALLHLGNINRELGRLDQAQEFFNTSLRLAQRIENAEIELSAHGNLGTVFFDRGDLWRAIAAYEQSLKIAQKIGNLSGTGNALGNLANVYFQLGENKRAIQMFEEDLAIARRLNDRRGERQTLNNLAIAYSSIGDHKRAIELCESSLMIAKELGDMRGEGFVLANLGNIYFQLNDLRRAEELSMEALAISQKTDNRSSEAQALGNLGIIYLQLGDPARARTFCQKQIDIVKDRDAISEGTARFYLALAMANEGDKEAAVAEIRHVFEILHRMDSPLSKKMSSLLMEKIENLQSMPDSIWPLTKGAIQLNDLHTKIDSEKKLKNLMNFSPEVNEGNKEVLQKFSTITQDSVDRFIKLNVSHEVKQGDYEALQKLSTTTRDSVDSLIKQSLINKEFF